MSTVDPYNVDFVYLAMTSSGHPGDLGRRNLATTCCSQTLQQQYGCCTVSGARLWSLHPLLNSLCDRNSLYSYAAITLFSSEGWTPQVCFHFYPVLQYLFSFSSFLSSEILGPGGALDSQTSDSQYLEGLIQRNGRALSPIRGPSALYIPSYPVIEPQYRYTYSAQRCCRYTL